MPSQQWSRLLEQDLILSFCENDHKHAIILLLESCRIEGIQLPLVSPTSLVQTVQGLRDKEDEAMMALIVAQNDLCQCSGSQDGQTCRRRLLQTALQARESSRAIQRPLQESSEVVCGVLREFNSDHRLMDFAEMVFQHSVVSPSKYVPRLAWWLVLCQRICRDLDSPHDSAQVRN